MKISAVTIASQAPLPQFRLNALNSESSALLSSAYSFQHSATAPTAKWRPRKTSTRSSCRHTMSGKICPSWCRCSLMSSLRSRSSVEHSARARLTHLGNSTGRRSLSTMPRLTVPSSARSNCRNPLVHNISSSSPELASWVWEQPTCTVYNS